MMIVDAVNSAPAEPAVYFLVTAYLESLLHFQRACGVPRQALDLPINGRSDLHRRLDVLQHNFSTPPESAVAMSELAAVIRSALNRLDELDEAECRLRGAAAMHSARTGSPHFSPSV